MKLQIIFYEDNNIKMEIDGNNVSFISKSSFDVKKEDVDFSFDVIRYLFDSIEELDQELNCRQIVGN